MCTFSLLFQLEEQSKNINHREDVAELKKRIHDLSLVRTAYNLRVKGVDSACVLYFLQ